MFTHLALLSLLTISSTWAQTQTTCRTDYGVLGPAVGDLCPDGYTVISDGSCCDNSQVVTGGACTDSSTECAGMKSYCNNGVYIPLMKQQCSKTCGFCSGGSAPSTCVDSPTANCNTNAALCSNSLYRDLMKSKCPKTCGYC